MEQYVNFGTTTLTASLAGTSTATLFSVGSPGNLPASPNFRCNIDNEIVLVTALSTTTSTVTFTCSRGQENTSIALHTSGAAVTNVLTTGAFNQVRSDINQDGAVASRPATPLAGDSYQTTDDMYRFVYNGSSWDGFGPVNRVYPPPGTASWTAMTSTNTSSLIWSGNTNGSIVLKQTGGGGAQINGIYMAISTSTTAVLTVCLQITAPWENFASYGIMFRESSSGKMVTIGPAFVNGSFISADKQTNQTTFSANYVRVSWIQTGKIWLRATDGGGSRAYSFSHDGINFTQIISEVRTDFITADGVGVFINGYTGAYQAQVSILSWNYA